MQCAQAGTLGNLGRGPHRPRVVGQLRLTDCRIASAYLVPTVSRQFCNAPLGCQCSSLGPNTQPVAASAGLLAPRSSRQGLQVSSKGRPKACDCFPSPSACLRLTVAGSRLAADRSEAHQRQQAILCWQQDQTRRTKLQFQRFSRGE